MRGIDIQAINVVINFDFLTTQKRIYTWYVGFILKTGMVSFVLFLMLAGFFLFRWVVQEGLGTLAWRSI